MDAAAGGGPSGNVGRLAEPLLAAANGDLMDCGKNKYWVPVDEPEDDDDNGSRLYRTFRVKGILINLYRLLIVVRVIVIILFFTWRMKHWDSKAMWSWWISAMGDLWLGVTWLLRQLPKLKPRKCIPNLSLLREQFDEFDIISCLPILDVFINTVDPVDEPMLYTMNSILSILSTDYPVEKYATYFSDDEGSLVHYEGLLETTQFAALWVPFCWKHCIEPRAPESYFWMKMSRYTGKSPEEFLDDHRRMRPSS